MRHLFRLLACALTFAAPAGAGDNSALRSLMTGDDSRGWEAVGRLDLGHGSFCTGTLIAPDLVLTAGHCMFNPHTGQRVAEREIQFLAGWRNGRASAYRGVRRAVLHPEFSFTADDADLRVRFDLALLELDQPIRSGSITPLQTGSYPRKGAEVGVVSYAHDRADSPSLQELCHVLARRSGTLILSCSVDFGSSGAPIFVVENGVARIVSVVSAKAMVRDMPVSLGTSLEAPLAEMMAKLAESDGVFTRVQPTVRVLSHEDAQSQTGAKFLRP